MTAGTPDETSKELFEKVRQVADRVQILDIKLLECRAEQKMPEEELPRRITTNINAECHFDPDTLRLTVYPHLQLVVKRHDASPADCFLRIEARFALMYALRSPEGLEQEHFDAFAERNGIFNVWPYWREFVQSITIRMGLPSLTVPVFRVGTSKLKQDTSFPNPRASKQIGVTLRSGSKEED